VLSVSLKIDKIEYRAVVKLSVKEGLTPNEIHSKFLKVYGDSSPSFSTIKKWATYNATLRRVRVTIVAMCFLFYCCWRTCSCRQYKVFGVTMEIQQCFPFSLMSSYKIFRAALNNKNAM
jgi:hypothetical protein